MEKSSFKKALPILCGNTLEAYDFCLYGLLAPVFAKIFFPANFEHSLTSAFIIFALAYIARSLGAVFWGYIGDKYGRKPVLIGTLSIMAIPAIGMAITPTYESTGVLSCIIIVVLRLIQGFSFGGEHTTVIVTTYELAPKSKVGLFGCLPDTFASFGFFIGLCLIIIMENFLNTTSFQSYGWRFLFLISIIFIAIVSYVRLRTPETKPASIEKFKTTFRSYFKDILIIFLYLLTAHSIFGNLFFYNHVFVAKHNTIDLSANFFLFLTISLFPFLMVFFGYLFDKVNKINSVRLGYLILMILSIPCYFMMSSNFIFYIVLGYFLFQIITCFLMATFPVLIVNQSPKNHRVSVVSIGYGLAIIFGSFAPAINEFLISKTQFLSSPAYLIIGFSMISLCTTFFMKPIQG